MSSTTFEEELSSEAEEELSPPKEREGIERSNPPSVRMPRISSMIQSRSPYSYWRMPLVIGSILVLP